LWQAAHHKKKPVCTLLPASHVGEQTGSEKLAASLSPWQPLVKLFSQSGRPHTIKNGRGHTGNQLKSHAPGIKLICGPGTDQLYFFIRSFFILDKIYTVNFYMVAFYTVAFYTVTFYTFNFYTVQNLYGSKFIQFKIYTVQNLYCRKRHNQH
jgi:hypothetical protein